MLDYTNDDSFKILICHMILVCLQILTVYEEVFTTKVKICYVN